MAQEFEGLLLRLENAVSSDGAPDCLSPHKLDGIVTMLCLISCLDTLRSVVLQTAGLVVAGMEGRSVWTLTHDESDLSPAMLWTGVVGCWDIEGALTHTGVLRRAHNLVANARLDKRHEQEHGADQAGAAWRGAAPP